MAFSNIDVEEVFGDFVEWYGGIVSDRLKGKRTFNADYIFHDAKVVAELKTLKEDPFKNKYFLKSLDNKKREWIQRGYITVSELNAVTRLKQLPEKCRRDTEKLYIRPLKTHLEKANLQIKSTKTVSGLEGYKGLLILVSDGNFLLDPKSIRLALTGLVANGKYSGINTISYLTVNVVTTRPDDPTLSRLWTNFFRDADHMQGEVSLGFLDDLFDKWASFYSEVTGISLRKISEVNERGLTEVDLLKSTRFVRPPKSRSPDEGFPS